MRAWSHGYPHRWCGPLSQLYHFNPIEKILGIIRHVVLSCGACTASHQRWLGHSRANVCASLGLSSMKRISPAGLVGLSNEMQIVPILHPTPFNNSSLRDTKCCFIWSGFRIQAVCSYLLYFLYYIIFKSKINLLHFVYHWRLLNLRKHFAQNYTAEMAWSVGTAGRPPFTFRNWRKSSQWVGLLRKHAQLIADDVDVMHAFDTSCQGYAVSQRSRPSLFISHFYSWSCLHHLNESCCG